MTLVAPQTTLRVLFSRSVFASFAFLATFYTTERLLTFNTFKRFAAPANLLALSTLKTARRTFSPPTLVARIDSTRR